MRAIGVCGFLLISVAVPCASLPLVRRTPSSHVSDHAFAKRSGTANYDTTTTVAHSIASSNAHVARASTTSSPSQAIRADDYEKAYNELYDNYNYNGNMNYILEDAPIQDMLSFQKTLVPGSPPFHSVLVLGCSHGKGAAVLHDHGFDAYGIDVARKAIKLANTRPRTCGGPGLSGDPKPCFVQGSLLKMPYAASTFDVGISADVLEHIAPKDVPQVVDEISRVVRHHLFLKIANFKEHNKNGEKAGMGNLHLTTEGPAWWTQAFARTGWKVKADKSNFRYVQLILEK